MYCWCLAYSLVLSMVSQFSGKKLCTPEQKLSKTCTHLSIQWFSFECSLCFLSWKGWPILWNLQPAYKHWSTSNLFCPVQMTEVLTQLVFKMDLYYWDYLAVDHASLNLHIAMCKTARCQFISVISQQILHLESGFLTKILPIMLQILARYSIDWPCNLVTSSIQDLTGMFSAAQCDTRLVSYASSWVSTFLALNSMRPEYWLNWGFRDLDCIIY